MGEGDNTQHLQCVLTSTAISEKENIEFPHKREEESIERVQKR